MTNRMLGNITIRSYVDRGWSPRHREYIQAEYHRILPDDQGVEMYEGELIMPSFFIEQTFDAFNAIDSDVARACFAKMICEDKGEYITDTYVLNSIGSD